MNNSLAREILNFLDFDSGSYSYQRSILDSKPYQMIREDKKTTIIFNGIGIEEKDIKIEIVTTRGNDFLEISGETKNYGRNFNVNGRFSVDRDSIKNVEWHTQNGLIIIEVNFKESEKSSIEIKKKS